MSKLVNTSRTSARPILLAIRREDPKRIWERRAPLTPDAVYALTSSGRAVVEVESCNKRVFNDVEYEKAGARIVKSLSDPNFIIGIKEPPLSELQSLHNKNSPISGVPTTHLMFSHTAKGQEYNMPLLAQFLNWQETLSPGHPRLIDFELLKNEKGKRTVGFGWFAGAAGVLEAFSAMAQLHLENGIASPFLQTCRPYTHRTIDDFRKNLQSIGTMIANHGTPAALGPFIIGLTGTGNVSQGSLDMLKELPVTMIRPHDLERLVKDPDFNNRTVYLLHAKPEDYFQRLDGGTYSRESYYANPHLYKSIFHEKIAPYLTLFINGAGWNPGFPRLMSNKQFHPALAKASGLGGLRFTNIADISCDIEGGLEFLAKATTLSSPFYDIMSHGQPTVRMMSVDILPASIPLDASNHFSTALSPYLDDLISTLQTGQPGPLSKALTRATIAEGGSLMPEHCWLIPKVAMVRKQLSEKKQETQSKTVVTEKALNTGARRQPKHKVLLLGSGMVSAPALDYLVKVCDADVVVAGNQYEELSRLCKPYPFSVQTRVVDFQEPMRCQPLIEDADVVISLLPADMHANIAKICIASKTPMVTASYIGADMQLLDEAARKEGVLLLNEVGLDPGIDHLSAMHLLDKLKSEKKNIHSFTSFCGGLPSPQDALGVPLKYKFSWRPQGVLMAALQEAQFRLMNKTHYISGDQLLTRHYPNIPITPEIDFEGLPNRDSLKYLETYDLGQADLRTFIRGTLRYPGYSSLMHSFASLGLLNYRNSIHVSDWSNFVTQCMMLKHGDGKGVLPDLSTIIAPEALQPLREALEWLGLARPTTLHAQSAPMPLLPAGEQKPIDVFAHLLSQKLKYGPGERDLVVLSHEIITTKKGSLDREVHTSKLITYGTDVPHTGFQGERPASAMARTVGLPIAIAAILVAEERFRGLSGVHRPTHSLIYRPMLERLAELGLVMQEKTMTLTKGKGGQIVESALIKATTREGEAHESKPRLRDLSDDPKWREEDHVEWASTNKSWP